MRTKSCSTQSCLSVRFVFRLVVSVLFLSLLVLTPSMMAQEDDAPRAGLVVQFGDGSVYTACVDLRGGDGEAMGEELLRASGLEAVADYDSGFGSTVCKIGNEGCNFPAEDCFCQCTMKPGDPCIYWAYFHLLDGQWRYSALGANSYVVHAGDVEGWTWGPGTMSGGIMPPLIPFEQLCSDPPTQIPPQATATGETTATQEPTPEPAIQLAVASTPPATSTAPPAMTAKAVALGDGGQNSPLFPEPSKASNETINYIFFGALAVALVAGLVASRVRQRE